MREYAFTVEYDRGADPVTDVFIDHPELLATALTISVSLRGMWRVDRVAGPPDALDALDAVFTNPEYCNECLGRHPDCDVEWQYEVVAETRRSRTVYAYQTGATRCHSVPFLATKHLGDGLLFDAQRRGDTYEWRLLLPDERRVGDLFEALGDDLGEGVGLTLRQVGTPARWGEGVATLADLPHEQREALETAVGMGYYGTPRGATLGDVADELGLADSTLRYRLRRAEAWLTETFVAGHGLLDGAGSDASAVESGGG